MDLQDTLLSQVSKKKKKKEYYLKEVALEWYFKLTENSVLEVINLFPKQRV